MFGNSIQQPVVPCHALKDNSKRLLVGENRATIGHEQTPPQ
jgi:hypothetical protein